MFLGPFSVHKRAILRPAYFFILLFTLFGLHFSKLRSPFSFYPFGLRPFLVPFWASKTYVTRVNPKTVVATKFSFSTIIFFSKLICFLCPFGCPKRMLQVLTQKRWLQRNFHFQQLFFSSNEFVLCTLFGTQNVCYKCWPKSGGCNGILILQIIFFHKWVRSLYPFGHPKRVSQVLVQKR